MMDLKEMTDGRFYTRVGDLVDELKDAWVEVDDAGTDKVTGWREENGEDVFYTLTLAGTERTLYVKDIKREVM